MFVYLLAYSLARSVYPYTKGHAERSESRSLRVFCLLLKLSQPSTAGCCCLRPPLSKI
mgnify:CR=1 FL=1